MSFYGQVIQQIQGAISKIIVKKDVDSKTEIASAVTLQGDGIIYPEVSNDDIITLKHKKASSEETDLTRFNILMQDKGIWRRGEITVDSAGHAQLNIVSGSEIAVLTATDDKEGNIIFS